MLCEILSVDFSPTLHLLAFLPLSSSSHGPLSLVTSLSTLGPFIWPFALAKAAAILSSETYLRHQSLKLVEILMLRRPKWVSALRPLVKSWLTCRSRPPSPLGWTTPWRTNRPRHDVSSLCTCYRWVLLSFYLVRCWKLVMLAMTSTVPPPQRFWHSLIISRGAFSPQRECTTRCTWSTQFAGPSYVGDEE